MRFKIDENLHGDVATLLASEGHDAETVYTEALQGCDDAIVAQHCIAENRVLVTLDLDFSDIRAYPPASHAGIIVLRVRDQSRKHVLNIMTQVVDRLKHEPITGRLWIASEANIRIRS